MEVNTPLHFRVSAPPAPDTNTAIMTTHTDSRAGRLVKAFQQFGDKIRSVQADLSQSCLMMIRAIPNTTTFSILGFPTLTVLGTATARAVTTAGGKASRAARVSYLSAATAGSVCGLQTSTVTHTIGDGSAGGGFFYSCRFSSSDAAAVSGARMFVGLRNGLATTNFDPAAQGNCVAVAQLAASTNLQIVYGGTVAQTPIDLGASFPAWTTTPNAMYELVLYAPPGGSSVGYRVTRLDTGAVASGVLGPGTAGTTLPSSTTILGPTFWRCNNATALAVALDVHSCVIENQDT